MRKIAKYVALVVAFMLIVFVALRFGFKEALVSFVALISFAIYALLDNLDELDDMMDQTWDDFLENLESAINEMEHNDLVKKGTVVERSEGDAEDDA